MNDSHRKFSVSILHNHNINLTMSIVGWLLVVIPKDEWFYPEERLMLENELTKATSIQLPKAAIPSSIRKDKRNFTNVSSERITSENGYILNIYTDYEYAKIVLLKSAKYNIVESLSEANFLLTALHITDFYGLPLDMRVNQFPFEGGFVRKDLLTLTIRAFCYKSNNVAPVWWLPAYDLSTEFHYFVNELQSRKLNNLSNNWILKPSNGTRAVGHYILLDSEDITTEAAYAAPNVPLEILSDFITTKYSHTEGMKERVAQLLIYKPLLVRGLKFDLRTFVFVRSFHPLEAYLNCHHYARLANKPYDTSRLLDNEIVLTVNAYNDDENIANKQSRIFQDNLKLELENEYSNLNYELMFDNIIDMMTELFIGLGKSVGYWPNSSAYYAIDVMFDTENMEGFTPQAKLLEINFMGDWEAARLGSKNDIIYNQWIDDLMTCLCTTEKLNTNRNIKLQENWRDYRYDFRQNN